MRETETDLNYLEKRPEMSKSQSLGLEPLLRRGNIKGLYMDCPIDITNPERGDVIIPKSTPIINIEIEEPKQSEMNRQVMSEFLENLHSNLANWHDKKGKPEFVTGMTYEQMAHIATTLGFRSVDMNSKAVKWDRLKVWMEYRKTESYHKGEPLKLTLVYLSVPEFESKFSKGLKR